MDGVPVFCVGANVDVELDVAVGVLDCVRCGQDVLEADVESCVGVGVEGVALLADDVARAAVIVAYGILNLQGNVSDSFVTRPTARLDSTSPVRSRSCFIPHSNSSAADLRACSTSAHRLCFH